MNTTHCPIKWQVPIHHTHMHVVGFTKHVVGLMGERQACQPHCTPLQVGIHFCSYTSWTAWLSSEHKGGEGQGRGRGGAGERRGGEGEGLPSVVCMWKGRGEGRRRGVGGWKEELLFVVYIWEEHGRGGHGGGGGRVGAGMTVSNVCPYYAVEYETGMYCCHQ